MTGIAIVVTLLAAGAPVPEGPVVPQYGPVERFQVENFARIVLGLAVQVKDRCAREGVQEKDLIAAAVRGLYEEAGVPLPESLAAELRKAEVSNALFEILVKARLQLGDNPKLSGCRSVFAAVNGFKHATDPISTLVSARLNTYAGVDQDFGVGVELDGVTGTRWTLYQAESTIALRRVASGGYIGSIPKPEEVASPAQLPWRIKRVVPGSPAQTGGIKPGDLIVRLDGVDITTENANRLFHSFAIPRTVIDAKTGRPGLPEWTVTIRRENATTAEVVLKNTDYAPESAFGVIRTPENTWDCMLDRQARIGYIRIGPIESGLDIAVAEMVGDLVKRGCRGLILDLRWCPGGYIDPGARIAGLFLKEGTVLAKMKYRNDQFGVGDVLPAPAGSGGYLDLPLVLLVGQETTGGGELIAAALRDNNRCVICGQRSVGRASIQNTLPANFAGLQFKLTTGTSFRPNGKNRQRLPTSQPTDEWGIRPDEGLEVPVTLDKSMELRRQADLQAIRPADSNEALPFDDPDQDPYRLAALTYFRKKNAGK